MPSMTSLPPGPLFLYHLSLRNLPTLILYYGVIRLFIFHLDIATPTWLAILIALSARLAFYVTLGRWRVYRANLDAAAQGAVMVPRVREYGFSNLRTMVDTISSGYPMDAIHKWCEEYGSIFEISVIADHLMYTVEPQHVKVILPQDILRDG
ncbi:hypothetical protein L208DRAFT_1414384 [Tricholoma matsutake]|nr:hypothetical protein L208DRAFT_1414384 [Tricholoma matsutake 945]